MHEPYFINVRLEKFSPDFFVMDENIIPASAPMGVSSAPRLEPIIEAYIAALPAEPVSITEENNTLMGMLFTKLELKNEAMPYSNKGE